MDVSNAFSDTGIKDRNFDEIAEHFAKKVYGDLKGAIRLAVLRRDLTQQIAQQSQKLGRPLRILDVGAGLAQLSIECARQGHLVCINDISSKLLAMAKQSAADVADKIEWQACAYQTLDAILTNNLPRHGEQKFDLIFCHAVLEWLFDPKQIMAFFDKWLADQGVLSLCFYNPNSLIYRNLIMGNFNQIQPNLTSNSTKNPIQKSAFLPQKIPQNLKSKNQKSIVKNANKINRSLTPTHPVDRRQVLAWLEDLGYQILAESGLRVFSDYVFVAEDGKKRGGNQDPDAVLAMELTYSTQEPFKWLGRYLHILAQKTK